MDERQYPIDPNHDPLMQPIFWNGKEYRTSHFLHRQYQANSQMGGNYSRHDNFIRLLKRIEAYQIYLETGDLLVLPSYKQAMAISSKSEEINDNKALREAFRAINNHTLYLVNATIQVALSHHLDDTESKKLSVATNTTTARQLTGKGMLPTEQAERTLRAMLNIGRMIGTPAHIALEHGVKQALIDTGVDLQGLLIGAAAMEEVPVEDMMLEPEDLAKKLGVRSGILMNKFLAQIDWQQKQSATSPWKPTQAGERYAVIHPWMSHGKTGYNYKWNVEAVKNELKRRNMLPPNIA